MRIRPNDARRAPGFALPHPPLFPPGSSAAVRLYEPVRAERLEVPLAAIALLTDPAADGTGAKNGTHAGCRVRRRTGHGVGLLLNVQRGRFGAFTYSSVEYEITDGQTERLLLRG
jgi:hypothetical protein